MMNRSRNNRRNANRANRSGRSARIPKSITANTPFMIGRNKQIISVPSHNLGLTIKRSVRFSIGLIAVTPNQVISYQDVFSRFQTELNLNINGSGQGTFTPEWISAYFIGNDSASSVFAAQFALRIFDEPRTQAAAGTYANSPYFEATDSASSAGVCSIKAIIPKAATYSISTTDPATLRALPMISFGANPTGSVYIDIGGTYTVKSITGDALTMIDDKDQLEVFPGKATRWGCL